MARHRAGFFTPITPSPYHHPMPVAYPSTVPRPLKATKSRTQPASFRLTEPRRGYGYVQAIGTDMPVFWDVSWTMTSDQAMAFQLWFDLKLSRGLLEFDMPLRTEFGDVAHTCRFLPDTLLPASQDGQAWAYTAQIMARKLLRPAGYDDAVDLILALPDWQSWAGLLDQAVTAEMPSA